MLTEESQAGMAHGEEHFPGEVCLPLWRRASECLLIYFADGHCLTCALQDSSAPFQCLTSGPFPFHTSPLRLVVDSVVSPGPAADRVDLLPGKPIIGTPLR